jgi:hypothetical protein
VAETSALRVRSGLQFVQALRPALYALLVLSALFTFWAGGDIAGKSLPPWTQQVAPALFAIFLIVFAIYRFALVRARRYPAATGLFQVGLGALIWVLLLPGSRQKIAPPPTPADDLQALLSSPDPRVRALAAETAGYRAEGSRYAAELIEHMADADPWVREKARESLSRLTHKVCPDQECYREAARSRGWLR